MKVPLVLALYLLPVVLGCSCPFDYWSRTRSSTICTAFDGSGSVYRATVTAAYCKCLLADNDWSRFSCIEFSRDNGNVTGDVRATYVCSQPRPWGSTFYYGSCTATIRNAGSMPSNITNNTMAATNITCDGNIELISSNNASGCAITHQPCYYTVTVDAVYKGNYRVGQSLNTSGPDVLTSCGQYGRILSVGTSYIVGVGGTCDPFSDWTRFDRFTSSEIELLNQLGNETVTTTDPVCSSSMSTSSISTISSSSISSTISTSSISSTIITSSISSTSSTRISPSPTSGTVTGSSMKRQSIFISLIVALVVMILIIALLSVGLFALKFVNNRRNRQHANIGHVPNVSKDSRIYVDVENLLDDAEGLDEKIEGSEDKNAMDD